jgi:hypothetical protein
MWVRHRWNKNELMFYREEGKCLWDSLKELCMLISRSLERKGFCNRVGRDLSCLWNILMEMDHWMKMKEVEYVWSRVRMSNFGINLEEILNHTILHFERWWLKDWIKIIGGVVTYVAHNYFLLSIGVYNVIFFLLVSI